VDSRVRAVELLGNWNIQMLHLGGVLNPQGVAFRTSPVLLLTPVLRFFLKEINIF